MLTSKPMRVLWAVIVVASVVNAVRVLRQPEALQFFGVAILVVAAVAVLGTIAAFVLIAVRRVLSD